MHKYIWIHTNNINRTRNNSIKIKKVNKNIEKYTFII